MILRIPASPSLIANDVCGVTTWKDFSRQFQRYFSKASTYQYQGGERLQLYLSFQDYAKEEVESSNNTDAQR